MSLPRTLFYDNADEAGQFVVSPAARGGRPMITACACWMSGLRIGTFGTSAYA